MGDFTDPTEEEMGSLSPPEERDNILWISHIDDHYEMKWFSSLESARQTDLSGQQRFAFALLDVESGESLDDYGWGRNGKVMVKKGELVLKHFRLMAASVKPAKR